MKSAVVAMLSAAIALAACSGGTQAPPAARECPGVDADAVRCRAD